jgi:heme A synthase
VGGLALLQACLGVLAVLTGAHLHVSLTHQFMAALLWAASVMVARVAVK